MKVSSDINLFSISNNTLFLNGMQKFLKDKNHINFSGCSKSFINSLNNSDRTLKRECNILFVNDESFSRDEVIDSLKHFYSNHLHSQIKSIVFTGKLDPIYLTELWLLRVSGIFYKNETNLKDFFRLESELKEDTNPTLYSIGSKFIYTLRSVHNGSNYYDNSVLSLLLRRYNRAFDSLYDEFAKWEDSSTNMNSKNRILRELFIKPFDIVEAENLKKLTFRQREIMHYRRRGYSNQQIAAELHISLKTIDKHFENIKITLGLNSLKELKDYF